jgi:hypothetical protein
MGEFQFFIVLLTWILVCISIVLFEIRTLRNSSLQSLPVQPLYWAIMNSLPIKIYPQWPKLKVWTLKTIAVSWILWHSIVLYVWNWQSYLRFDKLMSFSATPLPFLVGTEFLLWDFISATFDSLSKASCTFIVPRCLSLWPDIQDVVYKYWDICLIPNI